MHIIFEQDEKIKQIPFRSVLTNDSFKLHTSITTMYVNMYSCSCYSPMHLNTEITTSHQHVLQLSLFTQHSTAPISFVSLIFRQKKCEFTPTAGWFLIQFETNNKFLPSSQCQMANGTCLIWNRNSSRERTVVAILGSW